MKITYYGYNAFIIQWEDKKIAIDPGDAAGFQTKIRSMGISCEILDKGQSMEY